MTITIPLLIACGINPTQAKAFAQHLDDACRRFGITTENRVTGFLSQAMHESTNFTRMEENLYYSTPERIRQVFPSRVKSMAEANALARNPQALANRVYADRLGNGNEASGDGWLYRGRGIFQLTGKANYLAATSDLDVDYVSKPELVAVPEHACMTAANFWADNGCNELADHGDIGGVTARINGTARLGLSERTHLYAQVMEAIDATA